MWDRKILRKVPGAASEQEVWRSEANQELRDLHRAPTPTVDIKIRRLEWLEHGIRM
jgi:hypothetical protein